LDEGEAQTWTETHNFDPFTSAPSNGRDEQLETVELSTQQRLRIAELPRTTE